MFQSLKILGSSLIVLALFASGTKAELIPAPTLCEAIGEARGCVPSSAEPFPSEDFVVTDLEDQLFAIDGEETAIILVMNQGATGDRLNGTGFRLIGLQSIPRSSLRSRSETSTTSATGRPSPPAFPSSPTSTSIAPRSSGRISRVRTPSSVEKPPSGST